MISISSLKVLLIAIIAAIHDKAPSKFVRSRLVNYEQTIYDMILHISLLKGYSAVPPGRERRQYPAAQEQRDNKKLGTICITRQKQYS